MKVLFTSPILKYPATGGPFLRIETSIKALNRVCDLHVISRSAPFQIGGETAVQFYQKLVPHFIFAPSVSNLSSFRYLRGLQKIVKKCYANDAQFIVSYARKHQIKVIWFGFGNLSFSLIKKIKQIAPELTLVSDTDSVWSRFIFRELPFIQDEKERTQVLKEHALKEAEEKCSVDLCDMTTAVSEIDAQYYRRLTPIQSKIALFSNVLDLSYYPEKVLAPSNMKRPAIYLAGTFGKATSSMNRAALWLLNDILPLVKKRIPNVHCYIVGYYSDICFGHINDPNITVTGMVDSVLPYLKNCDVALTPLLFESGTRFKILEAAACRVPMVSTTLGAEGLPVQNGEHLLIADTTETFAQAIVELLTNKELANRLALNSYELVKQQFGLDRLTNEAIQILDRVANV